MSDTLPDIPDFTFGGETDGLVPDRSSSATSGSGTPLSSSIDEELGLTEGALSFYTPEIIEKMRGYALEQVTENKYRAGVTVPEGFDPDDFFDTVNGAYTAYTELKRLPGVAEIERKIVVPAAVIGKIIVTDEFVKAINARGVPWESYNKLSSQQMLVAQIVTNPTDKRPLRAKLKSAGVTYPQYRAWMNQPVFSQYMNRITEGMLIDHLPDFNTVLTNKGLAGDINAIKYINELSGRHDPNRQALLDLQAVVQNLLEIIQRNVTDPATFQRIAAEFQLSMAVNNQNTIQGEISHGPHT